MEDDFEYVDTTPVDDSGMTRAEVAAALDLHLNEVRRIEMRALEKVRRKLIFHPRLSEIQENIWAKPQWLPRLF
jgi:hypothetical protein